MTTIKTSELAGPALDWAVATTGEWKTAHEHFPTMTLDPRFSGVSSDVVDGFVRLVPRNPFRQDYQPYSPSTDWALGGPIISREMLGIMPVSDAWWRAGDVDGANGFGPTPLIAAMRCYVASKLGDTVDVPDGVLA